MVVLGHILFTTIHLKGKTMLSQKTPPAFSHLP